MWTEPTMPFGGFPGSDLSGSGNYGNFQDSPLRCF